MFNAQEGLGVFLSSEKRYKPEEDRCLQGPDVLFSQVLLGSFWSPCVDAPVANSSK